MNERKKMKRPFPKKVPIESPRPERMKKDNVLDFDSFDKKAPTCQNNPERKILVKATARVVTRG
jgi:hypothetical protein